MLTKEDIPHYAPATIEVADGLTIRVSVEPDENMGAPWEEHDGHGIVSEWTTREKAPGEMVLCTDHGSRRFYDFAATVKIARKERWGAEGATAGERAHLAALADFNRLRAWCNDQWCWVGVMVEIDEGYGDDARPMRDSLWGIESDGDYWRHVAAELANDLLNACPRSFWCSSLPEVLETDHYETSQDVHTKTIVQPGIGGTVPVWGHFPRVLSTFALLLCLSLPALAAEPCKVNVNSATPAQLALLINTGPVLAGKIEAARTAAPLTAESLDAVPGVGAKWLEYNAPHVAYSGETTCTAKLRKPESETGESESDTVRREGSGGGQ